MKATLSISLLILVAVTAVFLSTGCDRMDGEKSDNLPPIVRFVNTPQDRDSFSYAPDVYWDAYDPDGLISGYEYYDDTTQAARDAHRDNRLREYVAGIPAGSWVYTTRTQEKIYLGTEVGQISEHVFFIRAIDNLGKRSEAAARTFFRSNQAPNAPRLKCALCDTTYEINAAIPDTLLVGDSTSIVYPGIELLWQGSDPDDRDLAKIPLQFRWVLVRTRDFDGNSLSDTVRHPIFDDSNHVVGYEGGWSDWTGLTSVIFFGMFNPDTLKTGDYEFLLQVRDDGLTSAETTAHLTFVAIRPTFHKQLLLVDENKTPTAPELAQRGARSDLAIMAFYNQILPEAFNIAEELRLAAYQEAIPHSLAWDPSQVDVYRIGDINNGRAIPYRLIADYRWVWIIDDDNADNSNFDGVLLRQKILSSYLDVGGQLQISGRRVLNGSYFNSGCGIVAAGQETGVFFSQYFNMFTFCAKPRWSLGTDGPPEFQGATTPDLFLPDLEIDSALCWDSLLWGPNRRYEHLPEIDYFSRVATQQGFDFSQSLYNYNSATSDTSEYAYERTGVDCAVISSTSSRAYLSPLPEDSTTVLQATRIYNRTRNCYGEFLWTDQGNGASENPWRIVVSTPEQYGRWLTEDTLEVDYSFVPISHNHNKPVAVLFQRQQGSFSEEDDGRFRVELVVRYRTALFTFPFSFMDTTPVPIQGFGLRNPVAVVIANQILYFNQPIYLQPFEFEGGG